MSGNNKHMVVPQLRFPEFRNAAEWATYNLDQLSKIVTEKVGDNDCIEPPRVSWRVFYL